MKMGYGYVFLNTVETMIWCTCCVSVALGVFTMTDVVVLIYIVLICIAFVMRCLKLVSMYDYFGKEMSLEWEYVRIDNGFLVSPLKIGTLIGTLVCGVHLLDYDSLASYGMISTYVLLALASLWVFEDSVSFGSWLCVYYSPECAICLSPLYMKEWRQAPNCIHQFHKVCLDSSLTFGHADCPLCRL